MADILQSGFNALSIPFAFLYAEIHYRFFPFFPSLLFKKEPEVICDIPHRLDPGMDLIIMLLLNDLRRFPTEPIEVAATISQPGRGTTLFTFNNLIDHEIEHPFKKNQRIFLLPIRRNELPAGEIFVNVKVTLQSVRKTWVVLNDNIPGTSKRAFRTYVSSKPLPGNELCKTGDMHVHSQYSQSHVEFGPPLQVIDAMASACGLDFVAVTDHSYDLSCAMGDYLREDQELERWKIFQKEITKPEAFQTKLIAGEEVTCLNASGKSVHLCTLGGKTFIPGSMDGARRHLCFPQSLTVSQVCNEIHNQGGIAIAAHPGSRSGLLQRILLHRGRWTVRDAMSDLDGFQALNSGFMKAWGRGIALWLRVLQQGTRLPLVGGNDAHGDFSKYRAIKAPFVSVYENDERHFGGGRTGIYGNPSSQNDLLDAVRQGATFVTTGPYISVNYSEEPDSYAVSCKGTNTAAETMHIHAISTPEFGNLQTIRVLAGSTRSEREERVIANISAREDPFEIIIPVDVSSLASGSYLRAEAVTTGGSGEGCQAFTSAVYLN